MAKTKISEFSATANSNTDINSINIAEGCAPSNINDAIRELMAELKDFQAGTKGDSFNGPVGTTTAAAGAFTTVSASGVITSTVSTGTAPLTIASTTKVTNLNADQLDGADWAAPASIGSTTPAAGAFTTLSSTGNTTLGDASGDTITINGTVQPGVIVSGSSSSDALRITQTGAGNALLVEDAANPDATPFVIDTDGNAVFGNASTFNVISPQTGTSASTRLQYTATSGANNSTFAIANWSTSGTSVSGAIVFAKSKSGTVGSQTSGIVASGDRLGLLDFQGSDGTSFVRAARIEAEVDGTPGTGDMPGRLVFSTTADGASATTERMRLTSAGNLLVNTTSAVSGSKLVVASADATIYGITVGRGAGAVSTNTAVGASALAANTTGDRNTAIGYSVLVSNTTGVNNVGVGGSDGSIGWTLQSNTTGANNVAVGNGVLYANTSGGNNAAVGHRALQSNTTGGQNTAVGMQALLSNTTASNNTAVGYQAAYSNTTSAAITAVGYQAMQNANATNATNSTVVGYQAGLNIANTVTAFGYGAAQNSTAQTAAFGAFALRLNTTGTANIAAGDNALYTNTTGSSNTGIGSQAIYLNTTGSYNTGLGNFALYSNTTASNNTAVGYQSSYSNTTGDYLTSVGWQSLYSNTTGVQNVAMGRYTLGSNTTGGYNVAVGNQALILNTTASNNTAVGYQAGYSITTNDRSVFVGTQAGYAATGFGNICVGYIAGNYSTTLTTGSGNILIGGYTKPAAGSNDYSLVIGWNAVGKGSSTAIIGAGDGGTSGVYQGNNSSSWSTTSDQRLKKNIVDNNDGLDKINAIRVRNFEYRLPEEVDAELKPTDAIAKTGIQLGVIAQELQAVLPECVKQESTGVLSVDPDNLTWYLVNAVKQLSAEVESLKSQLKGA